MELVDMKVSKTFAERHAGSSPALGTIRQIQQFILIDM